MNLPRALAAEAIGTFALVFAGAGAIMVDAKTGALGHLGVALSFGLVIMVMIYALGHVSGAHFNPSVSFAFALTRHFAWSRVFAYWAAQVAGALIAAAILRGSLGNVAHIGATLPSGSQGQSFLWELLLTFFLMLVIMAVATDTRAFGEAAAIAIGGTVGLDALFGGPVSGASMNPARSLGPAVVSGDLHALWLYLVAPLIGASLGALVYPFIRGETTRPTELPRNDAQEQTRPRQSRGGAMKYVLFVCTHNAGRSQMAQAFFERYAPTDVRAESAGQEPAEAIWPNVVETMREVGIDISKRRPKKLDLEMQLHADWAITLACGGACPYVPTMVEDWEIPDPAGRPLEEVREIRDQIELRVKDFVETRLDAIRADRTAHQMRLARLLPSLADEFAGNRQPEEIRACADAILNDYDEVPVRSFVLTLADRRIRECLREDECAVLA